MLLLGLDVAVEAGTQQGDVVIFLVQRRGKFGGAARHGRADVVGGLIGFAGPGVHDPYLQPHGHLSLRPDGKQRLVPQRVVGRVADQHVQRGGALVVEGLEVVPKQRRQFLDLPDPVAEGVGIIIDVSLCVRKLPGILLNEARKQQNACLTIQHAIEKEGAAPRFRVQRKVLLRKGVELRVGMRLVRLRKPQNFPQAVGVPIQPLHPVTGAHVPAHRGHAHHAAVHRDRPAHGGIELLLSEQLRQVHQQPGLIQLPQADLVRLDMGHIPIGGEDQFPEVGVDAVVKILGGDQFQASVRVLRQIILADEPAVIEHAQRAAVLRQRRQGARQQAQAQRDAKSTFFHWASPFISGVTVTTHSSLSQVLSGSSRSHSPSGVTSQLAMERITS